MVDVVEDFLLGIDFASGGDKPKLGCEATDRAFDPLVNSARVAFDETGRETQADGQQRNDGKERGVGEGRGADEATICDKGAADQSPEVDEFLY